LKYEFATLGFDKVSTFTAKVNLQSQNVMKKIGMKKVMDFKHPNIIENAPLYEHVLFVFENINK